MDWARAIEINQRALIRIVAQIYAVLGIVSGGTVGRLSYRVYSAAERLLRPAESALRRLIVIAARGVVVKPTQSRPMAKGLIIKAGKSGRITFKLFDTRKRFNFTKIGNPLYVIVQTYNTFPNPIFNPPPLRRPEKTEYGMSGTQLCRRLTAVARALETLPYQGLAHGALAGQALNPEAPEIHLALATRPSTRLPRKTHRRSGLYPHRMPRTCWRCVAREFILNNFGDSAYNICCFVTTTKVAIVFHIPSFRRRTE